MFGTPTPSTALTPLQDYHRRPYFKHHLHPEVYEPIFERFQNPLPAESFQEIAHITKVPLKTIYRWHTEFRQNADWRPDRAHIFPNRRMFTKAEEKQVADEIADHFLSRHVPVTLDILRSLVLAKYQEFSQASITTTGHPKRPFKCTRHFLTNFMRRNQLSYRCTRPARRPAIDPIEVERYRSELAEIHENTPWDRILNADESFWLILYVPMKTVAPTGVETVKVSVDGDPKAGLTLLGTITAAGTKLPLFLVAKGRTDRCHKQFGADLLQTWPVYIAHSPSGWVTQPVFLEYLSFLRQVIPDGPLCLVLDQYPTHLTPTSASRAADLNIRIVRVPKGATGIWQPLDRRIYGAMKSMARARWARLFARSEMPRATRELAAELALTCWKEISEELILEAWNFDETYPEEDPGDDIDSDDDDTFFDVEYGHDDLEESDIETITDT